MSKKQKKGRVERLRELSGAAQGELRERITELEEEVKEQKKTILIGAAIFLAGVILGSAVARRRGD